jgi:catechol 2,3-dioxygenase-like lactoylglutathione lyase family enzyme
VLLSGFDHVAVLTADTERLTTFYDEIFGATSDAIVVRDGFRMTRVHVGPSAELNVFEIDGNDESSRQVPMFGRGRLDHLALRAPTMESFTTIRDRLVARGASDGFVTDFGPVLSLHFRDPDGLEAEVCVGNPDAEPGVYHPPGTPSARFHAA